MGFTPIQMEHSTEVIGWKINSMARVSRHGLMGHAMKEAMNMVRSKERVGSLSLMALCIEVDSWLTKLMGLVVITGLILKLTSEGGLKTRCMDLENCNGQTGKNTKVNSRWIREMGMVSSFGLMAENLKEVGVKVNRTEMVFIQVTMDNKE